MEIRILGCYGGADDEHRLTSFLVDGTIAIDAGALTVALTLEEQLAVNDVYISHSHLDHTSTLPFLADNIYGMREEPLRVHAHAQLLEEVHVNLFNDIIWPDFSQLPSAAEPTLVFVETPVGKPFRIGHLDLRALWVDHVVPTTGLIVTEGGRSWVYSSDTGDTDRIWDEVNKLDDPRLLFLECSYPERLSELADASKHLTTAGVARQLSKIYREIPTRIYHAKPVYLEEIEAEIARIDHPDLRLLRQDEIFIV